MYVLYMYYSGCWSQNWIVIFMYVHGLLTSLWFLRIIYCFGSEKMEFLLKYFTSKWNSVYNYTT